jgi:phage-related protein
MKWTIEFYEDSRGNHPVQEFLLTLDAKAQAKLLRVIDLLEEFGLNIPSSFAEKLNDIWELKERFGTDRYRILYFAFTGRRFILLHAFIKKTQKTPKKEKEIAEARRTDHIKRNKV